MQMQFIRDLNTHKTSVLWMIFMTFNFSTHIVDRLSFIAASVIESFKCLTQSKYMTYKSLAIPSDMAKAAKMDQGSDSYDRIWQK